MLICLWYIPSLAIDFDLALRDERMLNAFGRVVSRKTRVALRNSLTRRFPAVPLSEPVVRAITKDGEGSPDNREDYLDLGDFGEFRGTG